MATTKEDVLEFISNMSVLELSELVKEFEEKFGVTAQATVVAAVGGADAGGAVEEQTEFDVVLTDVGAKKIGVIKAVRALTGLGLKEAKTACEELPSTIKEALEIIDKGAIKIALVVDENDKLLGIITVSDITTISPKLFDIMVEVSNIRGEEEYQPTMGKEEEYTEGICEICGSQGRVRYVDGRYVCDNCLEEGYEYE